MKNQARNLFLLAAEAFSTKNFDAAGTLFAASMSSDDSQAFIDNLTDAESSSADETSESSSAESKRHLSLAEIASSVATAMSEEADDDEDDDEDDEDAEEDGEDAEEEDEEDTDGTPSSISSGSGVVRKIESGKSAPRVLISMSSDSPVKLKSAITATSEDDGEEEDVEDDETK